MRRALLALLVVVLGVSLAANGILGWLSWRSYRQYLTLARQFTRVRQELQEALRLEGQARHEAENARQSAARPETTAPALPAATGGRADERKAEAEQPLPAGARVVVVAAAPASAVATAIGARYRPRFEAVQAECEGQLEALLQQAKAEYQQAKAAGAKVDVAGLGARYVTRATSLRRTCDRKVEALIGDMTGDLRAAGLPADLAEAAREEYEAAGAAREAEIMAKVPAN